MKLLKWREFSYHSYDLYYDVVTSTYWVTEIFNAPKGDINRYTAYFSLLSEAERFFDLLVAQKDV